MSHFNIITGDATVSDDSHNNYYLVGRDLSLTARDTSYDTFSIFGLHNTLTIQSSDPAEPTDPNATINDFSRGTHIVLSDLSSTSHVTMRDLQYDPTAQLTIVNGGFPNAASVIADSLPDGHGGTITQGSAGSIDFVGDGNIAALHINVVNT
jgi:hypothetical protein